MSPAPFKIAGECTIDSVAQLHQRLTPLLSAEKAITIDLSEMRNIDAAGIQLLISIKNSAEAAGRKLTLVSIPAFLAQSLQAIGLEPNFLGNSMPVT